MRRDFWIGMIGALLLACDAGVSSSPEQTDSVVVATRFVDLANPGIEVGLLPATTLGRDRRLTLRVPITRDWLPLEWLEGGAAGSHLLRLPPPLRGPGELEIRLQVGPDEFLAAPELNAQPTSVLVTLPESSAGRPVAILGRRVTDVPLPPVPIEVADVSIPAESELRFALAPDADDPTPVSIEFCSEDECEVVFEESLESGSDWKPRRVDFAPWAGRQGTFRFLATTADGVAGRHGVFGNPILYRNPLATEAGRGAVPHNLLLISLDTLGARHLGSYGATREASPFIDAYFRESGTVVEGLLSSEVHTGPAHISLFTSLSPTAHGVEAGRFRRLPWTVETLASLLREQGLTTGAVTENGALYVGGGFERGFDEYRELPRGPTSGIRETFAAAQEWLARNEDTRFFFFLHTYETHWKYDPPSEYDDLFAEDAPTGLPEAYSPVRYSREIRFVDDRLRDLFGVLESRGLLSETLVVVTSDHGEAFAEHGQLGHGAQVYNEVTHVPLFLSGPGVPRGQRIEGWLSQLDIAPTLLDLMGAPALADAMGLSFSREIRTGAEPVPRPAFSEAWFGSGRVLRPDGRPQPTPHAPPTYAVVLDDRKLIRVREGEGFRYEEYALDVDPNETRDLGRNGQGPDPALLDLLERYERESLHLRDALRSRVLRGGPGLQAPGEVVPDADRLEQLRELGYIE